MKRLKELLLKFNFYLKSKKTQIIKLFVFTLMCSILFCSNILLVSNFDMNIPESVIEIEENLKKELNDEQPYCMIYPKETTNFSNMAYRDPEKSAELRSIFGSIECIDWYIDSNDYKPFIYSFSDGSSTYLSLSLFPKHSYVQNSFIYDINLVAGNLKNINNAFDIFINQDFADKLISYNVYGLDLDYTDLLDKKIEARSRIKSNSITTEYRIAGVIAKDEYYKKYCSIFGNFAIVSEYFSLPLPCSTYINMYDNEFNNYNLIKTILNIYKYESTYSSLGVGIVAFPIEYRTYFYSPSQLIQSENEIVSKCNLMIDEVFDYYFYNNNLFPIIILVIILLVMVFSIIFSLKGVKITSFKNIISYLICCAIAMPFGSLIAILYKMLFGKIYSIANAFSLLLYLVIVVILFIILLLNMKKQIRRKQHETCNN